MEGSTAEPGPPGSPGCAPSGAAPTLRRFGPAPAPLGSAAVPGVTAGLPMAGLPTDGDPKATFVAAEGVWTPSWPVPSKSAGPVEPPGGEAGRGPPDSPWCTPSGSRPVLSGPDMVLRGPGAAPPAGSDPARSDIAPDAAIGLPLYGDPEATEASTARPAEPAEMAPAVVVVPTVVIAPRGRLRPIVPPGVDGREPAARVSGAGKVGAAWPATVKRAGAIGAVVTPVVPPRGR
jgi:hypothetical protein